MPAPANLSFETAGASPGLADGWTTTVVSTGDVADFSGGSGNPRSVEDYNHGWDPNPLVVAITGGTEGTFNGNLITPANDVEDYNRWVSLFYRTEMTGGTQGQFDGGLPVENYNDGWPGDPFLDEITNPTDFKEDYDEDWPGDPLLTEISGGTTATFNTPGGTATVEEYEDTFADVVFVVDLANNRFVTSTAHGLTSNQLGEILTTGKRPGGVPPGVYLHVVVVSPTTFQVSVTPGPGSAVTLTDIGYGQHRFKVSRAQYWTEVE